MGTDNEESKGRSDAGLAENITETHPTTQCLPAETHTADPPVSSLTQGSQHYITLPRAF